MTVNISTIYRVFEDGANEPSAETYYDPEFNIVELSFMDGLVTTKNGRQFIYGTADFFYALGDVLKKAASEAKQES
jgi:hypothetical protein